MATKKIVRSKRLTTPGHGCIEVDVEPLKSLNFSMLHNDQNLFRRFVIRRVGSVAVEQVYVALELRVGSEAYPFRMSFKLDQAEVDLNEEIRVPLNAVGPPIQESIHASFCIEVSVDGRMVHCRSYRVGLLPPDEWRDDPENLVWLPSFVLPRDPAVLQVIDAAQRYLMTLCDDAGAGFDGYQGVGLNEADPSCVVDFQVRAIWSALMHDIPLSYINPPPGYAESSQRVRSPSQIVQAHRGTCIDLTLLLAAVLEYVEIYPVVILLADHAFPAYWRDSEAYEAFHERFGRTKRGERSPRTRGRPDRSAWHFGKECRAAIMDAVEKYELQPLESVFLTNRSSFRDAVEEGRRNLKSAANFDSMIDIVRARREGVTPLPRD